MKKKEKYILAVLVQIVIILALVLTQISILFSPKTIFLKIVPEDPRDLLRGDYITFQYNISRVPQSYFRGDRVKKGDMVYVILKRSGKKYWDVWYVQKSKPQESDIFIKGRVAGNNFDGSIRIKYGIEEYYIPEGVGRDFRFFGKEVLAEVKVDRNGNSLLKQIYIDGKKWP